MQKIFQKMLNLAFEIYAVIIYTFFLHFLFHFYCNVPCLLGTTSIYEKLFPSLLHILRSSLGIVFLCFVSSSRVRINRSNQPCKKISHFRKIRKIIIFFLFHKNYVISFRLTSLFLILTRQDA